MPLRRIKAKAAQAAELLSRLKRGARSVAACAPVLVVYGQGEAASIYYEAEAVAPGQKPRRT
ncbi:MAG TPA: hypothetical protein VEJ89_18900 [Myxococcaceae bacterium]|nr:hypothetical protein [Myxococcaceae bacterium]